MRPCATRRRGSSRRCGRSAGRTSCGARSGATARRRGWVARHHAGDEMAPYERLLGDALRGDTSLFAREDNVEAAWRVVDPILGAVTPVHEYEPQTWGPAEADRIIAHEGGWRNPTPLQ